MVKELGVFLENIFKYNVWGQ